MSDEKPKTIHRKKFMGGVMTPTEAHVKYGWWGKICGGCGAPPIVRCLSFAPIKDLESNAPALLLRIAAENNGQVPIVEFTYGKFVRVGEGFACSRCRRALEKTAAKRPSWILVEFQEAPKSTPQVQVPDAIGG